MEIVGEIVYISSPECPGNLLRISRAWLTYIRTSHIPTSQALGGPAWLVASHGSWPCAARAEPLTLTVVVPHQCIQLSKLIKRYA